MLQVPLSFVFSSGVNRYHAINVVCGCHCGINVDLFFVIPVAEPNLTTSVSVWH